MTKNSHTVKLFLYTRPELMLLKLLKRIVRAVPISFWRFYIRYAPLKSGKLLLLEKLIAPFLQQYPRQFVCSTVFGGRIGGDTEDIIQRFIYFHGVWEPRMTSWLQRRLQPGDIFIDIGANIGYYSLLASRLVGRQGKVIAIEPSPKIFRALESNLRLNKVDNVRAVRMAVSDRRETLRLYSGPAWNSGTTTTHVKIDELTMPQIEDIQKVMGPVTNFRLETEVEAVPLGDIVTAEEIKRARVIKIDCEGAEWAIASGMVSLLASTRADLEVTIEVIPEYLLLQGKTPQDILNIFSAAGFHAYWVGTEYDPQDYVRRSNITALPRLRTDLTKETNVIFSRQDVDELLAS